MSGPDELQPAAPVDDGLAQLTADRNAADVPPPPAPPASAPGPAVTNEYDALLAEAPKKPVNEYDAVVEDLSRERKQTVRGNLIGAQATTPEVAAKSLDLSRKTGVPADMVERNLPKVEADHRLNEYDAILNASPKTEAWIASDPINAKVAGDEVERLAKIEAILRPKNLYDRNKPSKASRSIDSESADWEATAFPNAGGLVYDHLPSFDAPLYESQLKKGVEGIARGGNTMSQVALLQAVQAIDFFDRGGSPYRGRGGYGMGLGIGDFSRMADDPQRQPNQPRHGDVFGYTKMSDDEKAALKKRIDFDLVLRAAKEQLGQEFVSRLPGDPNTKPFLDSFNAVDGKALFNALTRSLTNVLLGNYPRAVDLAPAGGESPIKGVTDAFSQGPAGIVQELTVTNIPNALAMAPALLTGAAAPLVAGGIGVALDLPDRLNGLIKQTFAETATIESLPLDHNDPFVVQQWLRDNPEAMNKLLSNAAAASLAISAGEVFALLAMKPLPIGKGSKAIVLRGAANAATGVLSEGVGELAAQVLADNYDAGEIAGEMFGALGPVVIGTASKTVQDVSRAKVEAKREAEVADIKKTITAANEFLTDLRAHVAEKETLTLDDLVEKVQGSNLHKLSPEKMKDFLESLSPDEQKADVFISSEAVSTLFQDLSVIERDTLAENLGITEQLNSLGLNANTDIVIPLPVYLTAIGDAHKAWRDDVRMDFMGFSNREAIAEGKAKAEETAAAVARFEELVAAGVVDEPKTVVYQQVLAMAKANGYTNEVAAQHAALFAAHYEARAARNPNQFTDALDAFHKAGPGTGVNIQTMLPDGTRAMGADVLDVMLDSIRSGKDPATIKTSGGHAVPVSFKPDRGTLEIARRLSKGWGPEKHVPEPQSLTDFVRNNGGLNITSSEAGDLRASDLGKIAGLLQKKKGNAGRSVDNMAQAAKDAGFVIGDETKYGSGVDVEAFISALIADASKRTKTYADNADTSAWQAQQDYFAQNDRWLKEGVEWDPKGRDPREIAWFLSQDPGAQRLMALSERPHLGPDSSQEVAYLTDAERAKAETKRPSTDPGDIFRTRRQELADALLSMGIDPAKMSNAQIRAEIEKVQKGTTLDQAGAPLFGKGALVITGTGPHGKITVGDVGRALTADHIKKHKRQFFPENDKRDYTATLKFAKEEVAKQLERANSGVGWYGKDVALAVDLTGQIFPTINDDPVHRRLYLTFAGLFSSGQDPDQAWQMSAGAFRDFLDTGEIPIKRRVNPDGSPVGTSTFKDNKTGEDVTKPKGWGTRSAGNEQQLALLKFLAKREGGLAQALDWLFATHPKTEINDLMTESGLYKEVRFTTKKQREGETFGFLVFGEKLGRYMLGLQGVEITADDTTVDLWYTRTFRRWTGRLLETPLGAEGVAAQPANDLERSTIFRLTADLAKEFDMTPGDTQAVLWFFEKRLWAEQGIRTNEGTNSSGARKLLRGFGLDDGTGSTGPGDADNGGSGASGTQDSTETGAGKGVTLDQDKRGSITFGDTQTTIQLFQARDLSTLAHEAGHLWLAEMEFDVKHVGAGEQMKADWQTILDYVGSTDGYINRDQHELFARSLEAYLMEGKAPSDALRKVFRAFKSWLLGIYRNIRSLQAPISPEMRQVFDRMLATDEEIASLNDRQGLNPVLEYAKELMSKAEFAAYTKKTADVVEEQQDALFAKVSGDLRRQASKEVVKERAKIRGEVTDEMMAEPGQRLLYFLKNGKLYGSPTAGTPKTIDPKVAAEIKEVEESIEEIRNEKNERNAPDFEALKASDIAELEAKLAGLKAAPTATGGTPEILKGRKLSRAGLIELIGQEGLNTLPAGIHAEEGLSPDEMAPLFGLDNGAALVERLMQIAAEDKAWKDKGGRGPAIQSRIAEETQRRLTEALGDPLNDGSIEAEAWAIVHSDKRLDLMAVDLRMLARKAGQAGAVSIDDIKNWAAEQIGGMSSYQATQVARYQRAERMAGQQVQKALVKGDWVAAFKAKQDQVYNFALYKEAKKASEDNDSIRKRMDRYASAAQIKSMDQGALNAIHEILEEFDFKKRSGALLAERTLFNAFAEQQKELGIEVLEPPRLKGAQSKHFSQMTMDELRGLSDTIEQMAKLGRLKKELIDGQKKRDFEAVVAEGVTTAGAQPQRGVSRDDTGLTPFQERMGKLVSGIKSGDSSLIKLETLFEWLDGDKTGRGIFTRLGFKPFADAQGRERDRLVGLNAKLKALYALVPQEQRDKWLEVHSIQSLPKPGGRPGKFNKTQLISMALNIGNQSNLEKLTVGMKWDEVALRATLDKYLTREEWALVQGVWDLIETQWPELKAVHERVTGLAPPKIEPIEVKTPYGTLKGGYYPAVYDPNLSTKAAKIGAKADLAATVGEIFPGGAFRPSTRAGATHARTGFEAPIRLSLDVIVQHLTDVAHDIEFREAILNAHKFFSDDRIKQSIIDAVGPEYEEQIDPWLKNIAHEWVIDRQGLNAVQKFANILRTNVVIVGLGFRISTMLAQTAGYSNSIQRLGAARMADGMRAFAKNPVQQFQFVHGKSAEMRHRANDLERDLRAAQLKMQGKTGYLNDVRRFAFAGIAAFDAAVSIPTWIGAYNQGLAEHKMTDEQAVYYADKMVRDTQGSGAAKDMSAIQRGGPLLKLFTMFYSYFNVFYNRQRSLARDVRDPGVSWGSVVAQTFWLLVIPSLLSPLLTGQGPGDDEEWAAWTARNVFFGLFTGVPYGRDVANAASNKMAGKPFGDPKLSPVEGFGSNVVRLGNDIWKAGSGEDVSKTFIKNIFNVAGVVTALPLGQPGSSAQYVWDVLIEGSENPENLLEWMRGLTIGPKK